MDDKKIIIAKTDAVERQWHLKMKIVEGGCRGKGKDNPVSPANSNPKFSIHLWIFKQRGFVLFKNDIDKNLTIFFKFFKRYSSFDSIASNNPNNPLYKKNIHTSLSGQNFL
jgi:hypothetical protein